jgi:hypothetical protein
MTDFTAPHFAALEARYSEDLAAISAAADAARAAVDGDLGALHALSGNSAVDPANLLADIPMDELPPYVPPLLSSEHALIPDTPLIDSPISNTSLAFDDAPLWQN